MTDAHQGAFDAAREAAFYIDHLKTVLLPFWLQHAIDDEYGAFYTCFNNEGNKLLSQDKFTWSQGRFVWVWSKLAEMGIFTGAEREHFAALARAGAAFLMKHCLLPNGACAFLMSRDGTHKRQAPGMPLDSSIYADCFVILGLGRYAGVSGDRAAAEFALRLHTSVARRIASGTFNSEPYPAPAGYRQHGIPMIMLNTSQELAAGLAALGMPEATSVEAAADDYMRQTLAYVDCNDQQREYVRRDGAFDDDTLLGRHINPGHTIEDMWFVMHQARGREDRASQQIIARAVRIAHRAFAVGWDAEFGGLLHFADKDGGAPRGSTAGMEDERVVQQVLAGWGDKLWWVHSEALYTMLLAYYLSGDASFLSLYRQAAAYTFRTFPNPDRAVGEWVQIRDRAGKPQQKLVALPVKDPFHILRNVALIIDLLTNVRREQDK